MSLSDHLRYLRALAGGVNLRTIAEDIHEEKPIGLREAEQRYRPIPNAALIEKLAAYYGRPVEEFHWHNQRARRFLTIYLLDAKRNKQNVQLQLRHGETLTGQVEWVDLGAIGLQMENGRLLCIQRHAVVDWPGAGEK